VKGRVVKKQRFKQKPLRAVLKVGDRVLFDALLHPILEESGLCWLSGVKRNKKGMIERLNLNGVPILSPSRPVGKPPQVGRKIAVFLASEVEMRRFGKRYTADEQVAKEFGYSTKDESRGIRDIRAEISKLFSDGVVMVSNELAVAFKCTFNKSERGEKVTIHGPGWTWQRGDKIARFSKNTELIYEIKDSGFS